jgi:hypothetical protein
MVMKLSLPLAERAGLQGRPVLSTFSKGALGSLALNFGSSGGENCETFCPHLKTGRCYSIRTENRFDRKELKKKLARHDQTDPADLVERATEELGRLLTGAAGPPPPWFRFSAAGSVPKVEQARKNLSFLDALEGLLALLGRHEVPTHFPVESRRKQLFYGRRAERHGVTVRLSARSAAAFLRSSGAASVVVGKLGQPMEDRVTESVAVAQERRARTGRTTVVCPAIVASFWGRLRRPSKPVHCGECTACAMPDVDIVYPLH